MTDYALMNHLLYIGEADTVREMTEKALEEGLEVDDILQKGLIAGMSVVGEDFKHNRLYVPQVLIAARAMKAGMAILKPLLTASSESASRGTIVMGTVKGDLHDIGKNLVCMMAEGAGFTMINLGVDTSADDFLQAVKENNAGIVGMSALYENGDRLLQARWTRRGRDVHWGGAGERDVRRRDRRRWLRRGCFQRGRTLQRTLSSQSRQLSHGPENQRQRQALISANRTVHL